MKIVRILFCAAAVVLFGCRQQQVHLIDGRSFQADRIHDDGERLQFAAGGWTYNFPSFFRLGGKPEKAVTITRVEVFSHSIVTPDGQLRDFGKFAEYLDKAASRESPIIVGLVDSISWEETRRQEFGKAYGEVHKRPYVGFETYWPKKWLPGEPGRELATE